MYTGGLGLAVTFESDKCSKLFDVFTIKDSNKLNDMDDKFGMSQVTQCHEIFELAKALYTGVDMCMHSALYHLLQSSHATPLSFQVTAL